MYASVIGKEHNANQDFVITGKNYGVIADGCSSSKYSEVGTRVILQLYGGIPTCNEEEKFEENITYIMEMLISLLQKYNKEICNNGNYTTDLLMNNLFFTLLACFEKKDEYVIYMLGDGYIITQNKLGVFSYIHSVYSQNKPPYIVYNYCMNNLPKLSFKKYIFKKEHFNGVGIASDGIEPFVRKINGIGKEGRDKFEDYLVNKDNLDETKANTRLNNFIKSFKSYLIDDTTVFFMGGKANG